MRAYLRLDPLIDERKGHYTPAQLGAYVKVLVCAMRQRDRGRFRSVETLRKMLPPAYARQIEFLVSEEDIVVLPDGRAYVQGWDEWQEGDITVGERMARLRNRNRNDAVTGAYLTAIGVSDSDGVGVDGSFQEPSDAREDIIAFGQVTGGRAPTVKQRAVLDNVARLHDVTGPKWAADIIMANPHDPIGAVIRADQEWRAQRKTEAIAEERASAERNRRPRGLSGVNAEIAKAMAERYGEEKAS